MDVPSSAALSTLARSPPQLVESLPTTARRGNGGDSFRGPEWHSAQTTVAQADMLGPILLIINTAARLPATDQT